MGPVPAPSSVFWTGARPTSSWSSGPPFDWAVSAPSSVFWTGAPPHPSVGPESMLFSSRGWMHKVFWTAEPPKPLSIDHTGYFGLACLPAPFLDWAAAGADHSRLTFLTSLRSLASKKRLSRYSGLMKLFQQCVLIDRVSPRHSHQTSILPKSE